MSAPASGPKTIRRTSLHGALQEQQLSKSHHLPQRHSQRSTLKGCWAGQLPHPGFGQVNQAFCAKVWPSALLCHQPDLS